MSHIAFKISMLLFVIAIMGSCITTPFEIPFNKVDCYFQYEYINYAWAKQSAKLLSPGLPNPQIVIRR